MSHAGAAGTGVRHAQWLRARAPESPAALVTCITELLESHPEWESLSRADAFVNASEVLLRRVLVGNVAARASALDLLASDACVTWAFEAAADEPGTIAVRAVAAELRIAALAAEFREPVRRTPHPSHA